MELKTIDVISVCCAVQRELGGYFKEGYEITSNKSTVSDYFFGDSDIDVLEEDRILAAKAIEYLKGLALKSFERRLSDYERLILKLVAGEDFNPKQIGLAASIPSMYLKQSVADDWYYKEQEIGRNSKFINQPNERITVPLTIQFVKKMEKFDKWLTCCTDDNQNIVKFFAAEEMGIGKTYTISGTIKPHAMNNYTGFKETFINRIKIVPPDRLGSL